MGLPMSIEYLSVLQFCEAHAISRSMFFKLTKAGRGPRTTKIGRKTVVSIGAASEWRKKIEGAAGEGAERSQSRQQP